VQCANENGKKLEEWYWLHVQDRTWKVAGMILPFIVDALKGVQAEADLAAAGG